MREEKSKKLILESIRKRVIEAVKKKGITQMELVHMCKEAGYQIAQPEISRLLGEKGTITLYEAVAFSEVLELSIQELISGMEEKNGVQLQLQGKYGDIGKFVVDPREKDFNGLLGTYYVVFYSTAVDENKLLEGKLLFTADAEKCICRAKFVLKTGIYDKNGKEITKVYWGQLIIGRSVETAYCILASDQVGEICMIEFRYRHFMIREMECRIGLCLTASAGEPKRPITHKMLLTRKYLSGEVLEAVLPMLQMDMGELIISRVKLQEIEKRYPQYKLICQELGNKQWRDYIFIHENTILESNIGLNKKEQLELIRLFKEREDRQFHIAIRREEDRYFYYLYDQIMGV